MYTEELSVYEVKLHPFTLEEDEIRFMVNPNRSHIGLAEIVYWITFTHFNPNPNCFMLVDTCLKDYKPCVALDLALMLKKL